MRHYTSDSPEALGRLIALTLMADGAIDSSELKTLAQHNIVHRIGLDHPAFDAIVHQLCDDLLTSAYRAPAGQLELDVPTIDQLLDDIREPLLRRKALRAMVDIVNADQALSGGEAVLIAEAMKRWEIDLYEVADCSVPPFRAAHRTH